jgi:hypothetical protein
MILLFSTALEVSTGDVLQPRGPKTASKPSRKVLRRLEQVEKLPARQQLTLVRSFDAFLENARPQGRPGSDGHMANGGIVADHSI